MEPAAAFNELFQLASWSTEEPEVWAPGGLPVEEYASIDIFGLGTCSLQECHVPPVSSVGQQQLVEYSRHSHYAATSQHDDPIENQALESFEVGLHSMEMEIYNNNPIRAFEKVAREFKADIDMMKVKIHRYPDRIRDLDEEWYTVPRVVAIGPYHHGLEQLKKAERAKHVAAYHCIRESGCSVREMYEAVVSVADNVRGLYDEDATAGISRDDFRHMMFFDACFLVQYMVWCTDGFKEMDPSLLTFLRSNRRGIHHDVMLLENQLPWRVVDAVRRFRPVRLEEFVAPWRDILQDRKDLQEKPRIFDHSYEPPHLLGLLRFYIVGRSDITDEPPIGDQLKSISISVSAIELAEIGINLRADETTELARMGIRKKGVLFAELSMAPLSLDYARACWFVNMAALELCTTPYFLHHQAKPEDTAVCSYLRLLSMLVHREDDVHELRTKGILRGGGLTNREALEFFTRLQSLPHGSCYVKTMLQIESYRVNRRVQTTVHSYFHKKEKTICKVLTTIVAVFGIFGTLVGILTKLKSVRGSS